MTKELLQLRLDAEEETYMGILSPPVVPAAAERRVEIELSVPQEGIGRNEILAAYYPAMPAPLPDRQTVINHLTSWTVQLSRAEWYRKANPQTAIIFGDPNVAALAPVAGQVLQATTDHIDPLARYSAGWVDSLKELQPDGLRGPVTTALREVGRYAAGQVVRAMVLEPGVRSSAAALGAFIEDPSTRHEADEQTALNAFLTRMERLVRDGAGYGATFTPDDTRALNAYAATLSGLGAEDTTVDEATLAEYRTLAREALQAIVLADRSLLQGDFLAAAFESLTKTYVNKLVRGESVDDFGTRYVKKRIKAKQADEARTTAKDGDSIDDDRPTAVFREPSVAGDPADRLINIVRVVETAIAYLDADRELRNAEGALCWEAEVVRAELLSELKEDDRANVTKRKFTARVREAWKQQRPTNARSTSQNAAVKDCEILLRTTLNRAQRDLEDQLGGGDL